MLYTLGTSPYTLKRTHIHKHDAWEIVINAQGSGIAVIGDTTYPFETGTIMCIPPHMEHCKISKDGFYDLYLHVDNPFPDANLPDTAPILFNDDLEKSFENLLRSLIHMYYQKIPNKESIVTSLYNAAIDLLNTWLEMPKQDPLIENIKKDIHLSFTDPEINLTEILSDSGYNEDYIRRRFKEEIGMTPKEYLTQLRINYAKQLMEQNSLLNLSITNIATMSGYYDIHYFARIFKKEVGMTPSEYLQIKGTTAKVD